MRRLRFTVDPNQHVPPSLLTPPEWEPGYRYTSFRSRPEPNIKLAVTFGGIDTDINVLPLSGTANKCANGQCYRETDRLLSAVSCPRQSALEASTTTGNVTLHVEAPTNAHFSVRASSTFGDVCVFLPRTFQGPLTIMSSLGAPHLSAEVKRLCAPISEIGGASRWFVGDLGVWRERAEHGDEAMVGTTFGSVWVGYIGEEEEAKRALRWGPLQWGVNIILSLLLVLVLHGGFKFVCWILALVGLF